MSLQPDVKDLTINFFKRNLLIFVFILIPLLLSVYLRIQVLNLTNIDNLAEQTISSAVKKDILSDIIKQQPYLPEENKLGLAEKRLGEYKLKNANEFYSLVSQTSGYVKSKLRDETGHPYLLEIDPYYYARYVRNIIERGHIGDELKHGRPYNNHQLSPVGRLAEPNLHIWIGFVVFKVASIFNPRLLLTTALFYVPVIISALAVIPAFLIGKTLKNKIAGFFSALLIAIHPVILGKTLGGFFDTDPYNLLMPLLLIACFLLFFKQQSSKHKVFFMLLLSIFFGLYANLWNGWSFIFYVITFSFIFAGCYRLFLYFRQKINKLDCQIPGIVSYTILFASLIFFSGLSLEIFNYFIYGYFRLSPLANLIRGPLAFLAIKGGISSQKLLWPNIFFTVHELTALSFARVITSLGSFVLVISFAIGLVLLLVRLFREKKMAAFFVFLLWISATGYGITKGLRFLFLFAVPFSIIVGYFCSEFIDYFASLISKRVQFTKRFARPGIFGLCMIYLFLGVPFVFPSLFSSSLSASRLSPLMNDEWRSTLEYIRNTTNQTAIITSWWDFGHWFAFFADRPATFDGASQDTPQSYWVSRFYSSPDEKEAIGILRMLDCSANSAFNLIFSQTNDFLKSINTLNTALQLDDSAAKLYYFQEFGLEQAGRLVNLTHCNPPEAVVIVSGDMLGKSLAWNTAGNWNFTRAFLAGNAKKPQNEFIVLAQPLGMSAHAAEHLHSWLSVQSKEEVSGWIAPTSLFNQQELSCVSQLLSIICSHQTLSYLVEINKTDYHTKIISKGDKNDILIPSSITYKKDNKIATKHFANSSLENSLILFESGEGYNAKFSKANLADAFFTKLFFFEGLGLEHFELIYKTKTYDNNKIKVFKVKWT